MGQYLKQSGEILLHTQSDCTGSGGDAVKDGAGLGAFDGTAEQPLFSANGKVVNMAALVEQ